MLAYWLGGACGYAHVEPPEPEKPTGGGGGMGDRRRWDRKGYPRQNDDDEVALLVATAWVTVCQTD